MTSSSWPADDAAPGDSERYAIPNCLPVLTASGAAGARASFGDIRVPHSYGS